MTEFHSPLRNLPSIPDNLSVPQFLLDSQHSARPLRGYRTPWLIDDTTGRKIGFEELCARTFALANAFSRRWAIGESDVVCIFCPNHVDYPVAIWAVHRLGGIITTANPAYTTDELAHQLITTHSKLVLVHPDFLSTALSAAHAAGIQFDRIALFDHPSTSTLPYPFLGDLIAYGIKKDAAFVERRLSPGEGKTKLAFLSFSSGTTGKPKAVAIPHHSVIANVIQMAVHHKVSEDYTTWDQKRVRPGDVATGVLPFFHIYGLVVNLHFILFCGMSVVVIPKFNFIKFLDTISQYRITHMFLVPPQMLLFCKDPAVQKYDLRHIRFCLSAAAPLSTELTQQFIEKLPNCSMGQGYGLTESCTAISMVPVSQKVGTVGSVGQLLPGITARIVKADGTLAKKGEQGELVVKGPSLALCYANDSEATKETFVNGWLHTGDAVIMGEHDEIFVVDRLKEIMKVRGFQVAPAELEGHLLGHSDVSDVCVVSVLDDYNGEMPLAYVVLNVAAAERAACHPQQAEKIKAALIKHVADSKVKYKWLTGGVEFVDAIPKNPSGKILRRILRDKARGEREDKYIRPKL